MFRNEDVDGGLTRRAEAVWLHSAVCYRRHGAGRYRLYRAGYEEDVALGDTEQEARERLDTMIRHTDLAAIAGGLAAIMVAHAEGRHDGPWRVRFDGAVMGLSRSSPRTRLGMGDNDELRSLILDALPDGWTYGCGWWSPPAAPQTVAQMRRELEELRR